MIQTKPYPFGTLYDTNSQDKNRQRSFDYLYALFANGEFSTLIHPKGFRPNTEYPVMILFDFPSHTQILTTTMGENNTLVPSDNDTLRVYTDRVVAHRFAHKLANLLLA
jgi:hypothetical protein